MVLSPTSHSFLPSQWRTHLYLCLKLTLLPSVILFYLLWDLVPLNIPAFSEENLILLVKFSIVESVNMLSFASCCVFFFYCPSFSFLNQISLKTSLCYLPCLHLPSSVQPFAILTEKEHTELCAAHVHSTTRQHVLLSSICARHREFSSEQNKGLCPPGVCILVGKGRK